MKNKLQFMVKWVCIIVVILCICPFYIIGVLIGPFVKAFESGAIKKVLDW